MASGGNTLQQMSGLVGTFIFVQPRLGERVGCPAVQLDSVESTTSVVQLYPGGEVGPSVSGALDVRESEDKMQ